MYLVKENLSLDVEFFSIKNWTLAKQTQKKNGIKPVRRVTNLSPQIIEHLEHCGYKKCEDVLKESELDLITKLNLSLYTVRFIYFEVAKQVAPKSISVRFSRHMQFCFNFFKYQAFDMKHNKASTFLPTGLPLLDKALKGGLQCGKVTEIIGTEQAGKTQFCITMAMQALNTCFVLYIDTTKSFALAKTKTPQHYGNEKALTSLLKCVTILTQNSISSLNDQYVFFVLYTFFVVLVQNKHKHIKSVIIGFIQSVKVTYLLLRCSDDQRFL